MRNLTVSLGTRSYPIVIGPDLLNAKSRFAEIQSRRAAIVTNSIVSPLYLAAAQALLENHGVTTEHLILPDGEAFKTWESLNLI